MKKDVGYLAPAYFPMILPMGSTGIIIGVAGILIILIVVLTVYKSLKKKKSSEIVERRLSNIKTQFADLNDDFDFDEEGGWLNNRADDASDFDEEMFRK